MNVIDYMQTALWKYFIKKGLKSDGLNTYGIG